MLTIKQIQAALKISKVTLNQTQINNLLIELNIDITQCDESNLDQIVEAIKGKVGTNGSLTVGNSRKKNTLSVPEIPAVESLKDADQSANRQQEHTDIYTQKMMDTVEQVSERNLEMVKALPQLVEVRTFQKLHASSDEIADLWEQTNTKLINVMFGL